MEVWMCNMLTLLFAYNWFIGDITYGSLDWNMLTLLFGYNWFIGEITYGSLDVQYVDIIIWL